MKRDLSLSVEDFMKSLKEIHSLSNFSRSIQEEVNSPLNKMCYLQFKSFSREEMLNYENEGKKNRTGNYWDRNDNLYNQVLRQKSILLFSVFLEKDMYKESMSELSNFWIDKNGLQNANDNMINYLYMYEVSKKGKEDPELFFDCFLDYFEKQASDGGLSKVDFNVLKSVVKSKHGEILKEIFLKRCSTLNEDVSESLISYYREHSEDLTKRKILNKFLPDDSGSTFFITSTSVPRITRLTGLGFKFDQSEYEYKGKSLISSLLSSDRTDLINAILPAISSLKTKPHLMDEQMEIIKNYSSNQYIKNLLINMHMEELDKKLPNKLEDNKRLKI